MEGESSLPTLNKRVMISRDPKHPTTPEQQMEPPPAGEDVSASKKRKTTTLEPAGSFEAMAAGALREISVLVSEFSEALSERSANDAAMIKELDHVVTEAKKLKAQLTEKKKLLKQRLDQISVKL